MTPSACSASIWLMPLLMRISSSNFFIGLTFSKFSCCPQLHESIVSDHPQFECSGSFCHVTKVIMMFDNLIKSIDPRSNLAARIGWVIGFLSVALALLAGLYVSTLSKAVIEREIGALYASRAQHIADAIDLKIQSVISTTRVATSILGTVRPDGGKGIESNLVDNIRKNFSDAVWIGVTDISGLVIAGGDDLLENTSLASEDWFKSTRRGLYVAGPEQFPMLEKLLAPLPGGKSRSFMLISAPITDDGGSVTGFAVACFDMDWIGEIQRRAGESLVGMRPIDIFLLGSDSKLLNQLVDGVVAPENDLSDRINITMRSIPGGQGLGSLTTDNYLVGFAKSRGYADFKGTGWTVVIREAKQSAYLPANQTALEIALSCLVLGLGLSFATAFGTKFILRGLPRIAASADAIRSGAASEFVAIEGKDEVARISHSLAILFNGLKTSNEQLVDLNLNLDRRVTERTREVQRLSEETKNAALTRDRLRMSRDLHDTLAHSMLAMLTQIRMIRKLYKSKPELVGEELGHAEAAAQEGLNDARKAVTELRYFAVRDDGLEPALQKLLKRLKERMVIETALEIEDAASSLAGPKAEIVYRIAEEALHNIEKHADAAQVKVQVKMDNTDPANHILKLIVKDDGKGFDSVNQTPGRYGLLGMREQAEILGGKLVIMSAVGKGTCVQLEVSM